MTLSCFSENSHTYKMGYSSWTPPLPNEVGAWMNNHTPPYHQGVIEWRNVPFVQGIRQWVSLTKGPLMISALRIFGVFCIVSLKQTVTDFFMMMNKKTHGLPFHELFNYSNLGRRLRALSVEMFFLINHQKPALYMYKGPKRCHHYTSRGHAI